MTESVADDMPARGVADPIEDAMLPPDATRVVRSALWAAWGDAVGFPVELAREPREIRRRIGEDLVKGSVAWRRRTGGRLGPEVELPAGAYSDDTQLRLAVGRCIRASGRFDAETFSKIELPVFLSYELGAGRATRAAARALGKRHVRWHSNFFEDKGTRYVDGGGNGAAMRIQPHVWAATRPHPDEYLPAVLRNAVTTHGHPRGIFGAALHALALGSTLLDGVVPPPSRWAGMVDYLARLEVLIARDEELNERWLPLWERDGQRPWHKAFADGLTECRELVAHLRKVAERDRLSVAEHYAALSKAVGGLDARSRGAGHITAALALWLAWVGQEDPRGAVLTAANLRHSDTDTIASMAGALLGVVADDEPQDPIQDRSLLRNEAVRLWQVGGEERAEDFPHPDILHWQPPATQSDSVGISGKELAIAGLGVAAPESEIIRGRGTEDVGWQWLRLSFGQTVLVKRRLELRPLPASRLPRKREIAQPGGPRQITLLENHPNTREDPGLPRDVEGGVALVVRGGFDRVLIGRLLIHYAQLEHGPERAGAFGALVGQALRRFGGREEPSANLKSVR